MHSQLFYNFNTTLLVCSYRLLELDVTGFQKPMLLIFRIRCCRFSDAGVLVYKILFRLCLDYFNFFVFFLFMVGDPEPLLTSHKFSKKWNRSAKKDFNILKIHMILPYLVIKITCSCFYNGIILSYCPLRYCWYCGTIDLGFRGIPHEFTCWILLGTQFLRTRVKHTSMSRIYCCSKILQHVVDCMESCCIGSHVPDVAMTSQMIYTYPEEQSH